ncbi:16S rRNA (uracil(1498)-N(3))-methyltransferase [Sporolactobacillus sp. THM7-7]|nr:16S rRNA (uracil(1498)-N(3))-methyltransferase [Sporolactobacillus sp. THM7-7]
MRRYFVPVNHFHESSVRITGEDAKHIQRVMRMNVSDQIICANNRGDAFLCDIQEFKGEDVHVRIQSRLEHNPELPVRVTIVQGIPKGDKFDTIVQKGTECGAAAFIPFRAERSVSVWHENRWAKKQRRLEKIAKAAAEQSHRLFIPDVARPITLHELLEFSESFTYKAVAYEEKAKEGDHSEFPSLLNQMKPGNSLMAVIGPEGGLSPDEVGQLRQAGFRSCGLGPRILRTETAALYLLSVVSYHFELSANASSGSRL